MNVMDDRNDLKMVVNLLNRNCALLGRKMDENLDVSRGLHMSDLLDDRNDLKTDGNHVNRNYAPRDLNLDASRVNRNYAPRDLRMNVNLDGKNLHVK
jgi:hypothetical protein